MIKFLDGPASGKILQLRRAPALLRVVINVAGEIDALDQLDDVPEAGESIYAYRLIGVPGSYHLLTSDKQGRRCGGWYKSGKYSIVEDQPDDTTLRQTASWREWATQRK